MTFDQWLHGNDEPPDEEPEPSEEDVRAEAEAEAWERDRC